MREPTVTDEQEDVRIPDELPVLPAWSVAVAVRSWLPSAAVLVSQLTDQPSEPSASTPRLTVSTKNSTWVTALVTSLAAAVTRILPLAGLPGSLTLTDGGALSTVTFIVLVWVWAGDASSVAVALT